MMNHRLLLLICVSLTLPTAARADLVSDWNSTLIDAIRTTPAKSNPGNSTRSVAMMNATIYDVFQAIDRTHAPFLVNDSAPGASLDAAVAQAAYRTLANTYVEQQAMLDNVLAARLGAIPDNQAKTAGIALGNRVAEQYINTRSSDGWDTPDAYTPTGLPGHWSEDPLHAPQTAWGQAWGGVTPWAINNPDQFDAVLHLPALGSDKYVEAFQQVKDYGALGSSKRSDYQAKTGLFWAYDRFAMGPPPILFIHALDSISAAIGSTLADRARLFALASVAMADAVIAAWDVKFEADLWRPITAIRADAAHDDDDPDTVEDPDWTPLGAPDGDPSTSAGDFTPPFPAYTSGHATMGGAVFKALELFYGSNDFSVADATIGVDPVTDQFILTSEEMTGSASSRAYVRFTQTVPLDLGSEDSPEGENATSRVYLGIHWLFDGTDGIALGNAVAKDVMANHFQAVPEPGTIWLGAFAMLLLGLVRRRAG
ncbi:MAG: hypothetical protein IPK02_20615 [Candidatus Accumulibacter sp.]|uniref:Phosphatidic acid phosphatase type 2/haloperoxidase domain-containing protein n=1 Tax=Candidatus Accumulibacter affinis TaxID=2954384 RepID=A0A935TH28_9PROT|nr:hypothetical protein [Candidatus Accumulibacter affinis]